MDKESFLKVINNVKEITDNDLEELLEMSKFYPYCQVNHILIAKKYHDLQHGLAPAKLHKAAIYTPDRLHLKRIMEDDPSLIKVEKPKPADALDSTDITENSVSEPIHEVQEDVQEDVKPIEEPTQITSGESSDTGFKPEPEDVVSDPQEAKNEVDTIESTTNTLNQEQAPSQEETPPEKEDIRAELEKNIKEYKEKRQKEQNEDKAGEQSKVVSETPQESAPAINPEVSDEIIDSEIEEKTEILKEETVDEVLNEKQDDEYTSTKEDAKGPVLQQDPLLDQHQIIENFIKLNPSLSRFDLKFDEDQKQLEDLSIPKLTIGEHLISENLAIILHKQGKVQKALNIYEKLILKFPEKKAYFASCIEKIKNP